MTVFKTVANQAVLASLKQRLNALTPTTPRQWGTLTAHEMLCHLGDSGELVLGIRPRAGDAPLRRKPLMKFLGLWTPIRWPHGWRTNPRMDPQRDGTKPSQFAADRERVIAGLERIAAPRATLEPVHSVFGVMSVTDWQRYAFKHVDHHLRQFGQ